MNRYVTYTVVTSIAALGYSEYARALPPLGLTHIGEVRAGNLEIIRGSAYIGAPTHAVWVVDAAGDVEAVHFTHPELGAPSSITRVVEGVDGDLYAGARFSSPDSFPVSGGAALFQLDQPMTPVVTWDVDPTTGDILELAGVDRNLRGLGNVVGGTIEWPEHTPAAFFVDGRVEPLPLPDGAGDAFLSRISPNGYALGHAGIPGTLGSSVALWSPDGSFSFSEPGSVRGSLKDRLDGEGINVGIFPGPAAIQYGNRAFLYITGADDEPVYTGLLLVSQSDFAVLDTDEFGHSESPMYLGFFPGIVPDDRTQAVPLLDVFPELASVNFDRVTDLAAVDGRIYMTLHGEDGLYLFGARDPSVIPEPSAVVLAILAVGGLCAWSWRYRFNRIGPD